MEVKMCKCGHFNFDHDDDGSCDFVNTETGIICDCDKFQDVEELEHNESF